GRGVSNKKKEIRSSKTREIENKLSGMGKLQLMNSSRRKHSEHPDHADHVADNS
mgnify:CR=1